MVSEDARSRAAAARWMVAQDARWIADAMLSTSNHESGSGWLPLVLIGHSSRIVYEGSILLRSSDPVVGEPHLAALLDDRYGETIERSRHAGKLLDDTLKSYAQLKDEMSEFYLVHHDEFSGNAVWFARWLETDLGLYCVPGGRILGNNVTGHFRAGLSSEVRLAQMGHQLFEVAKGQGGALAVLAAAAGDATPPTSTFDYAGLGRMVGKDRKTLAYLANRYDPVLPMESKLLLLMVEAEINTTDVVLPLIEQGHEEAVFRARMISTYHALRTVEEILNADPAADSPATIRVRSLLDESSTRGLLDDRGVRQVRNRCMHYEIRNRSLALDAALPMFGIVEALCGLTFDQLNVIVRAISGRLAEVLSLWRV
ncbi:hypothetical protein ABZX12_36170 [Kribbella sp. NPDC003505]|uniref:hypothetical protein n=1 Tax=Kribbella sp. NPDC003505 TaxID=3154448 RepID=UPI0033B7B2B8